MPIRPGLTNYPYEIELRDGRSRRAYGLKLSEGAGSLQIGTVSVDDTVHMSRQGKMPGDFDEQTSWKGGRGFERLTQNPEGFWDSMNAWTLSSDHLYAAPQWYFARGLRSCDQYMPTRSLGDMEWRQLTATGSQGATIANNFTASASYSAVRVQLWLRRRGTPGDLRIYLYSDTAGAPNAALNYSSSAVADGTASPDEAADTVSFFYDKSGTADSLTSGTKYHVVVAADADDNAGNHWEIGIDDTTTNGHTFSSPTWSSGGPSFYFRVTDADVARRFYRFYLDGAFYIVDRKDDGSTASQLYINGDRGKATAGAATTITDTNKSWTASRFIGAWVKIIRGTGAGQTRAITANTTTALTVATWTKNPDNTSQYVIYASEWFTEITGHGLTVVSGEPAVSNSVAYFPQGVSDEIVHIRFDHAAGTPAHAFFEETATGTKGYADLLLAAYDQAEGPQLWRANNSSGTGTGKAVTVSRANLIASGDPIAWNTTLVWKTSIFARDNTYLITGLNEKNNNVTVFKENAIGFISNDRFVTEDASGVMDNPHPANGAASVGKDNFLYYSWLHSVVRKYGISHDNVGQDFRSSGLPDGREGVYTDLSEYDTWMIAAVDAGTTGTSSVQIYDGLGWHELVRGWAKAKRCRFSRSQMCEGTRNRIWSEFGGDLIYQEMPFLKAHPHLDSGSRYMHEAVVESAEIAVSHLPMFVKYLTALVDGLTVGGNEVFVDYQTDDDVHTTTWTNAGTLHFSPESEIFFGLQNVRKFAYRLRICSSSNSAPPDVRSITPNGFARTPFRMTWTLQIQAGGIFGRRGKTVSADKLMRWLLDSAQKPGRIHMRSVYDMANNFWVIIHPARMFPYQPRRAILGEEAVLTVVFEEA